MNEREALLALSASEPDGNDPAWQEWSDKKNAALRYARSLRPTTPIADEIRIAQILLEGEDKFISVVVTRGGVEQAATYLREGDKITFENEVRVEI